MWLPVQAEEYQRAAVGQHAGQIFVDGCDRAVQPEIPRILFDAQHRLVIENTPVADESDGRDRVCPATVVAARSIEPCRIFSNGRNKQRFFARRRLMREVPHFKVQRFVEFFQQQTARVRPRARECGPRRDWRYVAKAEVRFCRMHDRVARRREPIRARSRA